MEMESEEERQRETEGPQTLTVIFKCLCFDIYPCGPMRHAVASKSLSHHWKCFCVAGEGLARSRSIVNIVVGEKTILKNSKNSNQTSFPFSLSYSLSSDCATRVSASVPGKNKVVFDHLLQTFSLHC